MTDLKKNQETKHGGARPNSGRPKGAKSKLKVADFYSPEEVNHLVEVAKSKTIGDKSDFDREIFKLIWTDIFGKPTTRIAGDDDADPLKFIEIIRSSEKPN